MKNFDIVIIGGAATGSVLALALSSATRHQLQIAVVEKLLPNYDQQGGFDARSIALAYGSLQKLAEIRPLAGGDLKQLIADISTPIGQIQVSDQGHFGKTTLSASELQLAQLGAVVELAAFGERLSSLLAKQPNITLFCPNTVQSLERDTQECRLTLSGGEHLACKLLVAADGIQSEIAQRCGVGTIEVRDYCQSALIANVALSEAHNGCAFERFTPQGPFALLPLRGKMMSLVWCLTDPEAVMIMNDEAFLQTLQQQFGWQLGKFERVSKRFVYPLKMQKAERHSHHRLAVVGNAAQLVHPVAGQGFNLGMRDLFTLAQLVGKAFANGEDVGGFALLDCFEWARNADQARIMNATSGLISIFCCDFLPVQLLRNLGLAVLSQSQLARNSVARQALGL